MERRSGEYRMTPYKAEEIEFHDEDDIFYKQIRLPKGLLVPQHAHDYAHTTLIAVGSIRVWKDGELVGDFKAPKPLTIEAGTKHTFLALEESLIYCIHNLRGKDGYRISEEHKLWPLA